MAIPGLVDVGTENGGTSGSGGPGEQPEIAPFSLMQEEEAQALQLLAAKQQGEPLIENIEIIELIARGGSACVYKARHMFLDRIIAVKVMSRQLFHSEAALNRFSKEAKITSNLDHPNIIKILSFGLSEQGSPYLIMEYFEGKSLADELKDNGPLTLQRFKDIFLPVLSALDCAHAQGLVHRDIKPANILIARAADSASAFVKLVDFGIARIIEEANSESDPELTARAPSAGTPLYMSPEQCRGLAVDGRSDLYSLACVMYEALTGEPPFPGNSDLEIMHKHAMEAPLQPQVLSRKLAISRELARLILWPMAKDISARPPDASALAIKLNEELARLTLDKAPQFNNSSLRRPATNIAIGAVFVVVLLLVVICGGAKLSVRRNPVKKAANGSQAGVPIDFARQEKSLQWSLARAEKSGSVQGVRDARAKLAELYWRSKKYKEAELQYKQMLASAEIHDKSYAPRVHHDVLILLAKVCRKLAEPAGSGRLDKLAQAEKLDEARNYLEQALTIMHHVYGKENIRIANLLVDLSQCYELQHDPRALTYAKEAVAMAEHLDMDKGKWSIEPEDSARQSCLNNLGQIYFSEGRYRDAETAYRRLLSMRRDSGPLYTLRTARTLCDLADCLRKAGKAREAEQFYTEALSLLRSASDESRAQEVEQYLNQCRQETKSQSAPGK